MSGPGIEGSKGISVYTTYIHTSHEPTLPPTLTYDAFESTPPMVSSSQKSADWDTTQLLDVVHYPGVPERTLGALTTFISKKNYVGIARRLEEGDVVKLIDVIDQVCRLRLQGILLTTTSVTRSSDLAIGKIPTNWHCCGRWVLSVVRRLNSHTRRFYPAGWVDVGISPLQVEASRIRGGGSTMRKP